MKIFLPRSKYYYEDKVFAVEATVKRKTAGSIEHSFDISGNVSATGGDRSNPYSETNKTFDLSTSINAVKIFDDPKDTDNDPLSNTYKWALYKEGVKVDNATIHSPTQSDNIKITKLKSGSIRPEGIMIDNNTTSLISLSQSEASKYTLKGYAKADDGIGGITEKTVEFNFVLKRYVTIGDKNFLNYLKTKLSANAFNDEGKLDVISPEVYNLKDINVTGKLINSLQGIEHFTNLTDLSQNKALTYIHCGGNQLTTLDVTNNTALSNFICEGNQLTALDVTKNTALNHLDVSHNQLTTLNLHNNTALTKVECNNNKINDIQINNHKSLTDLQVSFNELENLYITNDENLIKLYCRDNKLKSLDISHNMKLMSLHMQKNNISVLDLRGHCNMVDHGNDIYFDSKKVRIIRCNK